MRITLKVTTNSNDTEAVPVHVTNVDDELVLRCLFNTLQKLEVTTRLEESLYTASVIRFLELDLQRSYINPPYWHELEPEKEVEIQVRRTLVGAGVFAVDYGIKVDM